ncbi:MAG: pyrimidine-nucleoside phosphorylase [Candidatus Hepatoplasma scabrum]|nr:MAG: pyrimidine-nucleoside phosphorylase [Candidatus Hepatoplasma sp.]
MINNITEIINKKANKKELTDQEIDFFVNNLHKNIKKYQVSAMLMAIKINGLNDRELITYHNAILNSGKILDLDENRFDKHSTGGLGDKVSIILAPILEAMGIKFWKLSGRGLGFTGGTIDKLESIKKFNTDYSLKAILKKDNANHNLIIGQSKNLIPADKYTYSIRDTSGSVDSTELIAASVMSKKIAMGAKNILIDLKVGSGAFFKTLNQAEKLGKKLRLIGEKSNRNIYIIYTNMNEPLGKSIGNSIEVKEAISFLKNEYKDEKLEKIISKIAIEFYIKKNNVSLKEAQEKYDHILKKHKGYDAFLNILQNQKVKIKDFNEDKIFLPKHSYRIIANKSGYFKFKNLEDLGYFLIEIKAGRKNDHDSIYSHAGVDFFVKNGDFINKGDLLAKIYSKERLTEEQIRRFENTYFLTDKKVEIEEIILKEEKW